MIPTIWTRFGAIGSTARCSAEYLSIVRPVGRDVERAAVSIRAERERAGLSLAQLSALSGISKAHLVRLEKGAGNPSLEILGRIAEALGVTVADLLGSAKLTFTPVEAADVPASLRAFADEAGLSKPEVQTLASIRFRGDEAPRTAARWRFIYDSLKLSRGLDQDAEDDVE
jgi:transcriptional regulator with XRE-family HTH domain